MPFTITPTPATGAYLTSNFKHVGNNGEAKSKGSLLYNAGGNYQLAMRAYDALTQAKIVNPSVTQSYTVTGQKTTTTATGAYPKVGDFIMLRFRREHPVASMAGTFIENEFVILAPVAAVIEEETNAVLMDEEAILATAATPQEYLGALITWLEDALTVTVLKTRYEGGWEYIGYVLGSMDTQYDAA
jgi:hypothetical protein